MNGVPLVPFSRTISTARTSKARIEQVSRLRSPAASNSYSSSSSSTLLDPLPINAFNYRSRKTVDDSQALSNGPLSSWNISVKDNFCTKDMPTTASSKMLSDFKSPFDATAVRRLRRAGARIVGKTNCDEFGMGSANIHSQFGPVVNPAQPADSKEPRVAGGSSGGAAASVKAGDCRAALASDTGGSIRLPASYCGVWGLKPSYGMISRWGLIAYADSLDTVGVMASNVEDVETLFDILSHYDSRDPTSMPVATRSHAAKTSSAAISKIERNSEGKSSDLPLSGLKVGVPQEYFPKELKARTLPILRKVLKELKSKGATLVSVSLPSTKAALSAYYVIASAEASSNLARYDGIRFGHRSTSDLSSRLDEKEHPYAATRSEGFGSEVQRRILLGTYALTSDAFDNYFLQAQRVRKLVQKDFNSVFRIPNPLLLSSVDASSQKAEEGVDVLIHPSSVDIAPTMSSTRNNSFPDSSLLPYVQDVLTVPASLAGIPSLSIPAGEASPSEEMLKEEPVQNGWPVGVTITSQFGCEKLLWKVAKALKIDPCT